MKLKFWVAFAFLFHKFYKLYRLLMVNTVQYNYIHKLCVEKLFIFKTSSGQRSLNHAHPYRYHEMFPGFFAV